MTEAIIVNPFEAIKVRMQSDRAHQKMAPTTSAVAREIIKTEGLVSGIMTKGLTATMGRNGFFNMIYFGFYNSVKDIIPAQEVREVHFPQNPFKKERNQTRHFRIRSWTLFGV